MLPGQLLAQRYQFLNEAGYGDLSVVYRALDTFEQRIVALKLLRDSYRVVPEVAQRYLRQAQLAAVLRGAHVVDIFAWGEDMGLAYIAAEWVDGPSLRQALDNGLQYTPLEAARMGMQIAEALEAAHAASLIHGDLKPENILLNAAGRAQVTDFGLNRALVAPSAPGTQLATPGHYLAPEVIQGHPPDARADLFSLGMILLELVAGTSARDTFSAAHRGLLPPNTPPPTPRQFVQNLPSMYESLLLRALRFNPAERYGSAAELARDLETFVHSEATRPPQPTRILPVTPTTPRIVAPGLPPPQYTTPIPTPPPLSPAPPLRTGFAPPPTMASWFVLVFGALMLISVCVFVVSALPGLFPDLFVRATPIAQVTPILRAVPSVIGLSETDARAMIAANGFLVGAVVPRAQGDVAPGQVLDQNPRPATNAALGAPIDLFVSTLPTLTPTPTATLDPGTPTPVPTGCLGDEHMSFNPPQPSANQPVLVDAYSARPHGGVALSGLSISSFTGLAQESGIYHWQWQAVPPGPGRYEYIFLVNNGTPCARNAFEIAGAGTVIPTLIPGTPLPPTLPPVTSQPGPPGPLAFQTAWGSSGTGNAQFRNPDGLVVSGNYVFVADTDNHRIQIFDLNGSFIGIWGHQGAAPGELQYPNDIAVRPDGLFVVADTGNQRVQLFDAQGNVISSIGREGSNAGEFRHPRGVAVDSEGSIYVADTNNQRVQKFNAQGAFIFSIGQLGPGRGQFNQPIAVATDALGMLYVVDLNNHRVQKFTRDGAYVGTWGGYGPNDGQFNFPTGIALDPRGLVYVVDNGGGRVQVFDTNGVFQRSWGTPGAALGQFAGPLDVAIAADGSVFVTDTGNQRVQKFK